MTNRHHLNETILRLLAPQSGFNATEIVGSLAADDWRYVLDRGNEHHFLPLLQWSLDHSNALMLIPEAVRVELSQACRRHTLRALAVQREMVLLHRCLVAANVQHVFLKGAYLAHFAYPHAGLRPMRDLDVLVSPQDATRVYDLLVTNGYLPSKDAPEPSSVALDLEKHLPPLRSPEGKVWIELHIRIDLPGHALSDLDAFQSNTLCRFAGCELRFLDPVDLLIHICVHAAEMHNFDNGPLVIADVGFLLKSHDIDWDRVWSRAAEFGAVQALSLTLALCESCWGSLGGRDLNVPKRLVDVTRQLCLRSFHDRANVNVSADVRRRSPIGAIIDLALRLVPSRAKLRKEFGEARQRGDSVRNYLRFWRRVLTDRAPGVIRALIRSPRMLEADQLNVVRDWLLKEAKKPDPR